MMQGMPTADDTGRTWWAWSGVAVRPVSDPLVEPADTVVLAGPVEATEADATRAFLRWFHLLRSDVMVNREVDGGLGEEWAVRPLRDGADRPHDPLAWDGRDITVATLTSCRTIEDLEALGNLYPLAKTLFGDRATRPLARALAESVFESLANGHTSFSAIRLAVALAPLCSSEQLVQVLSWDDRGQPAVPGGQIRALADDLDLLFGHIKSPRRRLALVEGAWSQAVNLAEIATDVDSCISALARRRKVTVASAVGYIERVAAGGTDEVHQVVRTLLHWAAVELRDADRSRPMWSLPEIVRKRATEAVWAARKCTGIGPINPTLSELIELRVIEQHLIMSDIAEIGVRRHPWLVSAAIDQIAGSDARRQFQRDELRQWTQVVRKRAQEVRPDITAPWMLDRWPVDLVGLINLVANHHRLTRTFERGSSSRARTWASFARDVSSFDLGDLAVPDNGWVNGLDGAVLPSHLTVSVARSSKTLLE
jgi:hypothetical protein